MERIMPKPTRATVVIESNSWNQLAAVILDDGRYSMTTEWCNYANHQVLTRHGQEDAEIDLFLQWLNQRNDHTMIVLDPCLLYTSPSPRDRTRSRMPSSA